VTGAAKQTATQPKKKKSALDDDEKKEGSSFLDALKALNNRDD
jgi:hypothetical protein